MSWGMDVVVWQPRKEGASVCEHREAKGRRMQHSVSPGRSREGKGGQAQGSQGKEGKT